MPDHCFMLDIFLKSISDCFYVEATVLYLSSWWFLQIVRSFSLFYGEKYWKTTHPNSSRLITLFFNIFLHIIGFFSII